MSLLIERVTQDFSCLTPGEKIEFLKRITIVPPGEWIEVDSKLYFIPEGPPATEEEERVFEQANAEIEAGRGVTLDELKRGLRL
ncbi:MAG TPA: hypothetical protein DCM26_03200 [Desulfotomaculum sp.]|jgi:hypothetical protein|nr:hypothetical protein [Desulfotomaculum sp.]